MSDIVPRLAPRSVAAAADFELLRVARTDLGDPAAVATPTLVDRIRGHAAFRAARGADAGPGTIIRPGRREA